jgi:hypothetical protein
MFLDELFGLFLGWKKPARSFSGFRFRSRDLDAPVVSRGIKERSTLDGIRVEMGQHRICFETHAKRHLGMLSENSAMAGSILERFCAAPESTQRGTRVPGEEAFDSLGSFLGCLLRIGSAQLASLDSIRDCLIDLRRNPRLTSGTRKYHVLE